MVILWDALEWAQKQDSKSIDHIITDFEYGSYFPLMEFLRVCRGTIMTFCSEKDLPMLGKETEVAYWIKTPSTKNYSKHLGRFVEQIHIFRQTHYDIFNTNLHWSNYTGVYTDMVEEKGWLWKKPLSLMKRLVSIYTSPGDLVADPYCGSGTTLEACRDLDRRWVGVDNDPRWVKHCKEQGL